MLLHSTFFDAKQRLCRAMHRNTRSGVGATPFYSGDGLGKNIFKAIKQQQGLKEILQWSEQRPASPKSMRGQWTRDGHCGT